jgi:putative SOS response-associated peptidase YedK
MCGRYVLKREDLEALVKQFGLRSLEEFHSRYNIAPTSIVPLIRKDRSGAAELTGMRWGLIPAWTKPDAPMRPLVNLRAETLVTRFRGALRHRRCVLPASGFYEWETVRSRRQPWHFAARDGGPMGLAGIWDTWRGGDGVELETCTILTTTPNATLARVHDRMPVLLTPEQSRAWIEAPAEDDAALERWLKPAMDEAITAVKVGPAVSNVRNDGPECVAPAPEGDGETEPQLSLGL